MKTETLNKIRVIVREMIDNKVGSMINDMVCDNTFDRELVDNLNEEEIEDFEDVLDEIWEGGNYGEIDPELINDFVDNLTDSYIERFEE